MSWKWYETAALMGALLGAASAAAEEAGEETAGEAVQEQTAEPAAQAASATLASIEQCVRDNAPAQTLRQRIELETQDRMGEGRRYDITGLWKRGDEGLAKLVLRVSAPADLRGSAFLMIEREGRSPDLFSYLPELDKVRRISARGAGGALFGSDFSYEDVQRLQNLASSANSSLQGEEERAGRPAWKLESKPAPDDLSAYTRIVSWIDRERCIPVAAEFFDADAAPAKVLSLPPDQVVREGNGWVAMEVSMEDRGNESRSTLRVQEVELDVKLGEKHFSEAALGRRR